MRYRFTQATCFPMKDLECMLSTGHEKVISNTIKHKLKRYTEFDSSNYEKNFTNQLFNIHGKLIHHNVDS